MKKHADLEKRIKALELEIAALKARPAIQYHYHYPQPQYLYPTYIPAPIPAPLPWTPYVMPIAVCTSGYAQITSGDANAMLQPVTMSTTHSSNDVMVVSCH
jgi:hypothetical protein